MAGMYRSRPRVRFDRAGFHAAVDATRVGRGLSWAAVARQTGLSGSTLSRMSQGRCPDLDGLAALATWSGLSLQLFIDPRRCPSALERIVECFHSDPNLTDRAAYALEAITRAMYSQLVDGALAGEAARDNPR